MIHRNWHLSVVRVFSEKTNIFENADFYRTNWQKCYLMHFHAMVPDIRSSGEHQPQFIDDFPAVNGKFSDNFLVTDVKVIDKMRFFVVFLKF